MTLYIAREASKLWRRVTLEMTIELLLLAEKWKFLLLGLIFQYLHGLAARGVHYLHRPGPILQDVGFAILPELGPDKGYISETVFTFIFFSFLLACQCLRVLTFMATQLPGPNYHCREGATLARLPPPKSVLEVLLINFPRGMLFGCGDLIFSSHMIFSLVFVRTYQKYGAKRLIKQIAWLVVVIQSLLIIAPRKHYTVDVVVAWYTVNLVVYFVDKELPEDIMERNGGNPSLLLPVNGKDARSKEELLKLMNGTSIDNTDRRPRIEVNGKILDDGSQVRVDLGMNGA